MRKILIMGLPGAGKTTLAKNLQECFEFNSKTTMWFNADQVRQQFNDWDFTEQGRIKQAERMRELADNSDVDFVICDFVAPLPLMREIFSADYTIMLDTIKEGRYNDTNKLFVPPEDPDYCIYEQRAEYWASFIARDIIHRCENSQQQLKLPL